MNLVRLGHPAALLPVLLLVATCGTDEIHGVICVYTARGKEQVRLELPDFIARNPSIKLACPNAPREDIWCESRWRTEDDEVPLGCESDEWEVFRKSTDDLLDALNQQAGRGEHHADVIWGLGMSHLLRVIRGDGGGIYLQIMPYAPAGLDNLEAEISRRTGKDAQSKWENFLDSVYQQDKELRPVPMWTGIDAFAVTFCVNQKKMNDAEIPVPETWSWESLTGPEFAGRIAMPKAYTSGTGFIAAAGILYSHGGFDSDAGWEFLEALDSNISEYPDSGDGPCNLAASDDSPVVVGVSYDAAGELTKVNPIVHRVFPADGVGYDIAGNALVDKATIHAASHVFLDWASQEAMAMYAQSTPLIAYPEPEIYPPGYPIPPDVAWLDYDFGSLAGARLDLQAEWATRFCPHGYETMKCMK